MKLFFMVALSALSFQAFAGIKDYFGLYQCADKRVKVILSSPVDKSSKATAKIKYNDFKDLGTGEWRGEVLSGIMSYNDEGAFSLTGEEKVFDFSGTKKVTCILNVPAHYSTASNMYSQSGEIELGPDKNTISITVYDFQVATCSMREVNRQIEAVITPSTSGSFKMDCKRVQL